MNHTATILALLIATLAAGQAMAAGPADKTPKYATREQLHGCLDSEDHLKSRFSAIEEQIAENNATLLLIQSEANSIVEQQELLDANNEAEVADFNKRVTAHNTYVNTANERATRLKADQDSYNADMLEHNKRCAALIVRLTDREAVLKERKAAGVSSAPP
jgi:peptidoglycan hydrolase CwlO-like protein